MDSHQIELTDLVSFYPERNDENLQSIISAKQEFRELTSYNNEAVPQVQGELFNHQIFFGRFMRFYDKGLVIDKPGTGKTCKVVTAMEWFQKNRGIIRNFFVIVPNKAVKNDVKQQIICKCDTAERYKTEGLKEANTLAGQRISASKGLDRYYKIFTHGEFARYLMDNYPDEYQIRENLILTTEKIGAKGERTKQYSGIAKRVKDDFDDWKIKGKGKGPLKGKALENYILRKVDEDPERYKLKLSQAEIDKRVEESYNKMVEDMSGSFFYLDEAHMLTISDRTASTDPLKERLKQKYYNQYYRLFHAVKRSKIVLTTATPMVNSPDDIRPIINLLRDENDLLPEKFDYINSSIEDVNYYFGGYISYVAPIDNRVDVIYQGEQITHTIPLENNTYYQDEIKVIPLTMSPFQNYWYEIQFQNEVSKAFKNNTLQASVFVYPDGSIGTAGLKKYASRESAKQRPGESDEDFKLRKKIVHWYRPTAEFSNSINTLEGINSLSTKFSYIIDHANKDNEGVIYVNIPYVEGGAIPLALCLEKMGYEVFRKRESVFETIVPDDGDPTKTKKKIRPYCPPREGSGVIRKIKKNFPKRKRCAIFSSEDVFPGTVNESALEIVNSSENVLGEYVKVIIITPVGKVGISVNNVSKTFTVTSDWNESNNIQKEYRGIRATSGNAKINLLKSIAVKEANSEGQPITTEELESIRVDLDMYRLAAIPAEVNSSDLDVYLTAKEKELRIQTFFRKLMLVAVDCALNKDRNQMTKYGDGSAECNYQACQYVCYGEGNYLTDYSTFDIYYLGEILESIIAKIIPIIKRYGVITYEKLFNESLLFNIPTKHIIVALSELINSKRSIKDKFGYIVYLGESDGVIYLDREYPINNKTDYSIFYYGKNLINVEFTDIDTAIVNLEANVEDIVSTLEKYDVGSDMFYAELDSLSISLKANILEQSLYKWFNNQNENFDNVIMNFFQGKWFVINEPVALIEAEIDKEASKSNRGRPRKRKIKKFRVNPMTGKAELVKNEEDEEVVFHILYTEREGPTKHGQVARQIKGEGRYRLYKPSEMIGWRELDRFELIAYNMFVQVDRQDKEMRVQEDLVNSDASLIYGRISGDGLWIVDKTKEPLNSNGQTTYRGKLCTTWTKLELVPVLFEIGLPPPEEIINQPYNKDYFIQLIQENIDNMKLRDFDQSGNKVDYDPNKVFYWADQQIDYYAKWIMIANRRDHKYSKPKLCTQIKAKMVEQNRIVEF